MPTRILKDSETGLQCMYDSVTMTAFGSVFNGDEDVEEFMDWLNLDPRKYSNPLIALKITEWRTSRGA